MNYQREKYEANRGNRRTGREVDQRWTDIQIAGDTPAKSQRTGRNGVGAWI